MDDKFLDTFQTLVYHICFPKAPSGVRIVDAGARKISRECDAVDPRPASTLNALPSRHPLFDARAAQSSTAKQALELPPSLLGPGPGARGPAGAT